jgi:hypothetical protein
MSRQGSLDPTAIFLSFSSYLLWDKNGKGVDKHAIPIIIPVGISLYPVEEGYYLETTS